MGLELLTPVTQHGADQQWGCTAPVARPPGQVTAAPPPGSLPSPLPALAGSSLPPCRLYPVKTQRAGCLFLHKGPLQPWAQG